jgi:hypothetical protein
MILHFFKCLSIMVPFWLCWGACGVYAQIQDFEADFQRTNNPNEFLPNWIGNEVSGGSSRIFQANGIGWNGSKAHRQL